MNDEHKGTLVILACHAVFDPELNCVYAEHPEDRQIYEAHLDYAFKHMKWRTAVEPLLVISGGYTKIQRRCSESRSYLEMARMVGLQTPQDIAIEEYALTSIENLLFSIYVYHKTKGVYPASIEAISWEFKRERFEKTLEMINEWDQLKLKPWPPLKFFPVGDLWGKPKQGALKDEKKYLDALKMNGIDGYFSDIKTKQVLEDRDVFDSRPLTKKVYTGYTLPF
ncbi:MAG: hypothetical protein GY928_15505 [Colwellia sp.]|nr:hypothetical protein [Colwellia sp.]